MSLTKQVFTVTVTADTTLVVNAAHIINKSASLAVLTLPATSNVGDTIQISGVSSNGWKVQSNSAAASQTILNYSPTDLSAYAPIASSSSTIDLMTSSLYSDTVTLVCTVANSAWSIVNQSEALGGLNATGGTVTIVGPYKIHTFTANDTFAIASGSGPVQYLVVGGGAGGGGGVGAGGNAASGGGGGAGGYLAGTMIALPGGSLGVTIGGGGSGGSGSGSGTGTRGSNGGNSVLGSITAIGGGGGGAATQVPQVGGSGGGGYQSAGAAGTPGQGNSGGQSGFVTAQSTGGGGAGTAGTNGNPSNGGAGLTSSISNTATTYAGGGGGGSTVGFGGNPGSGGTGGGGSGSGSSTGGSATANTGGGGGGAGGNAGGAPNGGNGGSGVIIVRYKFR